ncbi:unnamed protein product [Schistosoma haematobium]|nr:unnamed protein product [Schistosoma haematobium]
MGLIGEQLRDGGVGKEEPCPTVASEKEWIRWCRQTCILNVKGCSPKAYNSLINLGSVQLNYFIRYLITTPLSFL